jgi:hypothetical protein
LRRLFVKADALALVELLETSGLNGAAMEEPLLSAIVTDEPETTVPDQSLNRTARHVE